MNSRKTLQALSLLIVGIGFAVGISGCGQNSKSAKDACAFNLEKLGGLIAQVSLENGSKVSLDKLAEMLQRMSLKPQCPCGTPYVICDLSNPGPKPDRVFAYCANHRNLLVGYETVRKCGESEFHSLIPSQLLNANDIAAVLGKTAAAVTAQSTTPVDPDPTGTWTAGDRNSVYNRLTVKSSGTFSFQTVDFTGEVKAGYSGTWRTDGRSVRFEWGSGGADSGSCSGRRTGPNDLVFGSTTFTR